jgi:uncharacterized OB-fold protein
MGKDGKGGEGDAEGTALAPTVAAPPTPGGTKPSLLAMTECPKCHVSTPLARYCTACGAALVPRRFCSDCGARLKPRAAFCDACGVEVP